MLLLLATSALAADGLQPLPVDAGIYANDQGLRVGGGGVVHAVLQRGTVAGVGGAPIYARLEPGGEWLVEDVPIPYDDVDVSEAALDLMADGRPIVAAIGNRCQKSGDSVDCAPRAWVAIRGSDGWQTEALRVSDGLYTSVVVRGGRDWFVAAQWSEARTSSDQATWSGLVAWDGGGNPQQWIQGAGALVQVSGINLNREGGAEIDVFALDGQWCALYRDRKSLALYRGQERVALSEDTEKDISAVVSPDGTLSWLAWHPHEEVAHLWTLGPDGAEDRYAIDTGESGWTSGLTAAPDGSLIGAWYYYKSPYNKGLKLGVMGPEGAESWVLATSESQNIGWFPTVDVGADGSVAVLALDRSDKRALVWRFESVDAARAAAVAEPTGGLYRDRMFSLFAYAGGWLQTWTLASAPPSTESFSLGDYSGATGSSGVGAGLATQAGFAGHFGRMDFALKYLERNQDDEAVQKIQELQEIAGEFGIDKFPIPGSETQVHFRRAALAGVYTGLDGTSQPFASDDRMLEVRYVGKEGYHLGLRYHAWASPQDAYLSSDFAVIDAFDADADFTEGSFVIGWAVMDYLKKYEIQHLGPYIDAQAGIGFVDVALERKDDGEIVEGSAFTFPIQADLGGVAYKRWKQAWGAGAFAQAGYRVMWQWTGAAEPAEKGEEPAEYYLNFNRQELWRGPYLNVGVVF